MYKVFINQNPLILADTSESFNINSPFVDILCENSLDTKKILELHSEYGDKKIIIARNRDIEILWNLFFGDYESVLAAGGLVLNPEGKILFIYRNDKWDLPKGKIDSGEEIQAAALREVNEECGLKNHTIVDHLTDTYHTYPHKEKMVIKTTYWFLMQTSSHEILAPQQEEGITKVEWRDQKDCLELLKNSYGSIEEVIREYLKRI